MVQNIKDNIYKEKNKDRVNLFGQTSLLIKGIFIKIIFMEKVNIYGQMVENILEIGKTIKCQEKVFLFGQMEENTKENI